LLHKLRKIIVGEDFVDVIDTMSVRLKLFMLHISWGRRGQTPCILKLCRVHNFMLCPV